MGDRYELNLNCAYCNKLNYDIWYAPTCGSINFKCSNCGELNFIRDFRAVKKEDITANDLYDEFMNESNIYWDEEECKRIMEDCEERLANENR